MSLDFRPRPGPRLLAGERRGFGRAMKPYYKALRPAAFRPKREAFVRAVADLVKQVHAEVGGCVSVRQIYYQAVNAGLVQSGTSAIARSKMRSETGERSAGSHGT